MDERPLQTPKTGTAGTETLTVQAAPLVSLPSLAADYTFFTPAIFVRFARLGRDPVGDYAAQYVMQAAERPRRITSSHLLFSGLGQQVLQGELVDWDRRLYMVPKSKEQELIGFLLGMAAVAAGDRFYCRALGQWVSAYDPHVALRQGQQAAEIQVLAVAAATTHGLYSLRQRPGMPPSLLKEPPPADFMQQAATIIGGDVGAVEPRGKLQPTK